MSFKSRMFNYLLRNRHLFQGRLSKEVFDFSTSIQAFREKCERGAARFGKLPDNITVKEQIINGIRAEWLMPQGAPSGKVILYFHGGGYVSGSCSDHRGIISKFAVFTGVTSLVFEYRLAPEYPYPAAVDDSLAVYEWLLTNGYHAGDILFAGESAGGGLSLAALLAVKNRGIALPVAAVAISPWTDLTCSGDSYRTKNKVSLAPLDSWTVFSRYYAGENDPTNPFISPLYGDMHGLPPVFINSGMDDELFDDGEQFYLRARESGVDITFRAGEGMVHCYPLLAPMFREATEAMDEIVKFIKKYLSADLK